MREFLTMGVGAGRYRTPLPLLWGMVRKSPIAYHLHLVRYLILILM